MKRKKSLPLTGALIFTLCASLLTGCTNPFSSTESVNPNSTQEANASLIENAEFWKESVAVDGQTGLYELHADIFQGKDYQYIHSYGENLLFVQEIYSEAPDNDYEVTTSFCFNLYDPFTNEIICSLDTSSLDFLCTYYQVLDQKLLLYNDNTLELHFYNEKLEAENQYQLSAEEDLQLPLYPSDQENVYYINTLSQKGAYVLELSEDSYSLTPLKLETSFCSIQGTTPNKKYLMTYGLDGKDLASHLYLIDPNDSDEFVLVGDNTFFAGDLSDQNYLYLADVDRGIYKYGDLDGTAKFFLVSPISNAFMYDNNSLIIQTDPRLSVDLGGSNDPLEYRRYNASGQCLNAFSYSPENFVSTPVYLEKYNCMFFLTADSQGDSSMLIWDLSASSADDSTLTFYDDIDSAIAEYDAQNPPSSDEESDWGIGGYTVTLIPDIESYDWGDLADVNDKATTLENTYGIEIYLGEEVPEMIGEYYTEQITDHDQLDYALDLLESIFSSYPENFFPQLIYGGNQGLRVYLSGKITADQEGLLSEAGAYVTDLNYYKVMVLCLDQAFDWEYVVSHEISHIIDKRLELYSSYNPDALYSEEGWNSFNPEGFSYLNTYDNYGDATQYIQYPEYFVENYAVTYPTEDRAMLFGAAMSTSLGSYSYEHIFTDPENIAMQNKFAYYCQCIREGFDTTGWPETTPWEEMLLLE